MQHDDDVPVALAMFTTHLGWIRKYLAQVEEHDALTQARRTFAATIGQQVGIPATMGLRCIADEDGTVFGLALPGTHTQRSPENLPEPDGWMWVADLRALVPDRDTEQGRAHRAVLRTLNGPTLEERVAGYGVPERLYRIRPARGWARARIVMAPTPDESRMALWQGWPSGVAEGRVRRLQGLRAKNWTVAAVWPQTTASADGARGRVRRPRIAVA